MSATTNTTVHTFEGTKNAGYGQNWFPYSYQWVDTFEQGSTSHGRGPYASDGDSGGPWIMSKVAHSIAPAMLDIPNYIHGPVVGQELIGQLWGYDHDPISFSDLQGIGAKGIALCAPNNPNVSIPQILGEAREGFPRVFGSGLLKEKANFLKGGSSEYLNVEFGWKPMINDLKRFASSVVNRHAVIENFVAQSSVKVRRRHAFPPSVTVVDVHGGVPLTIIDHIAEGYRTETWTVSSWFSGAFKYYIPMGDDLKSKMSRYRSEAGKLLGVRLTPDTLWELAPWSWAVDWFTDTGSIMTNISNLGSDGLVMQYGYAMTTAEYKRELSTKFWEGQATSYFSRTQTLKRRIPASPFGFDVTFDGLSTRQQAIAAAVGITRAS